jgi:hypothetical protein
MVRAGVFEPPRRRVFVSSLPGEAPQDKWVDLFFEGVSFNAAARETEFAAPLRSEVPDPSTMVTSALPESVTDFVAVLNIKYLADNATKDAKGELARFVERVLAARSRGLLVFVAPLSKPAWHTYFVREVPLGDPERQHADWLTRLRETRFPWPEKESDGTYLDEIDNAIEFIFGEAMKRHPSS